MIRDYLINLPWLAQVAVMLGVIIAAGLVAVAIDDFVASRRWAKLVITIRERVQR